MPGKYNIGMKQAVGADYKGFKPMDRSRLAKEIRLDDIFKEINVAVNLTPIQRATIEKMFKKIAGNDNVIDSNELAKFMQELEKAAAKRGEKNILDPGEAGKFAKQMEEEIGVKFFQISSIMDIDKAALQFISAIVNVNDKKVAQEIKSEKEAEIRKNTTVDKKGNTTYTEKVDTEHNGHKIVMKKMTTNKAGKLVKIEYITAKNDSISSITDIYENGIVKEKVWRYKDGDTSTDTIDPITKKTTKTKHTSSDGSWSITDYTYDNEGRLVKEVSRSSDKSVTTTNYSATYGNYTEHTKYNDGNTNTRYWNDYKLRKEVSKKGKNVTETVEYEYNKLGCTKEIHKNGNGTVNFTVEYKLDSQGKVVESTQKDGNNKVIEVRKFKNGKETEMTHYSPDNTSYTNYYKADGYKLRQVVNKNAKGHVTETEDYSYDAKGRVAKVTDKNAKEEVIRYTSYEYPSKGVTKSTTHNADGSVISQCTSTEGRNGNRTKITEHFWRGRFVGTEEFKTVNGKGERVYKDASGKIVSEKVFFRMLEGER